MGTLSIDAQQSAQITKLQEDVEELTTKLNAAVADIGTIKSKVDSLITDITSLKDKIGTATYGNTTGGGFSADPILKRLHDMDTDFVNLSIFVDNHQANAYNHGTYGHGGSAGQAGRGHGGPALGQSIDISGASTSSTGSVTQTASNASTTGTYTTSSTNVVTIETDAASRAREVATSTLTKLRDL